ncbi:hypothetical protein FBU30_002350, partial [Linnemannia zychae]
MTDNTPLQPNTSSTPKSVSLADTESPTPPIPASLTNIVPNAPMSSSTSSIPSTMADIKYPIFVSGSESMNSRIHTQVLRFRKYPDQWFSVTKEPIKYPGDPLMDCSVEDFGSEDDALWTHG